jgi:hypothetical protein
VGVLEHLADTHGAVKSIEPLIKPGGLLFFVVPNISTFEPDINGPFQDFSAEHINFYCLDSLVNFMKLYGFELVLFEGLQKGEMGCGFRKTNSTVQGAKDTRSANDIERYIEKSKALDLYIKNSLNLKNEKLIVWGTGCLTLHLLAEEILHADNIKVFVDSNPHYAGGSFRGIPVIAPEKLDGYSERILISSFVFNDDILNVIKNVLNLKNEVISINKINSREEI